MTIKSMPMAEIVTDELAEEEVPVEVEEEAPSEEFVGELPVAEEPVTEEVPVEVEEAPACATITELRVTFRSACPCRSMGEIEQASGLPPQIVDECIGTLEEFGLLARQGDVVCDYDGVANLKQCMENARRRRVKSD